MLIFFHFSTQQLNKHSSIFSQCADFQFWRTDYRDFFEPTRKGTYRSRLHSDQYFAKTLLRFLPEKKKKLQLNPTVPVCHWCCEHTLLFYGTPAVPVTLSLILGCQLKHPPCIQTDFSKLVFIPLKITLQYKAYE